MTARTDGGPKPQREEMVRWVTTRHLVGERVRTAFERVERHLFVPPRSTRAAYGPHPVMVSRDASGVVCATSPPELQAVLLELAAVEEGQRVLLAGAAPGITAAMLDHLVGQHGQVTCVEDDDELAGRTRLLLAGAGHRRVQVLRADATGNLSRSQLAGQRFDVIIAAGSLPGIPPAWWGLLAHGGRLVMPLRWHGHTRVVSLVHEGRRMTADTWLPVDAPALRWECAPGGGRDVVVRADAAGEMLLQLDHQQIDAGRAADGAAYGPGEVLWSGVSIPVGQSIDALTVLLAADGATVARLRAPVSPRRPALPDHGSGPALLDGRRLAYLAVRRPPDSPYMPRWELGAVGHGYHGPELAADLLAQAVTWAGAPGRLPTLSFYRQERPKHLPLGGMLVPLTATRLLIRP